MRNRNDAQADRISKRQIEVCFFTRLVALLEQSVRILRNKLRGFVRMCARSFVAVNKLSTRLHGKERKGQLSAKSQALTPGGFSYLVQ